MAHPYTHDAFRWLVNDQPSLKALIERFPDDWVASDTQLKALLASGGASAVLAAAKGSQAQVDRIVKSGLNTEVLRGALPVLVRSRMMVLALKNYSLAAQTKTVGRVAFDEANAALLQGVLFEGEGLRRKPVDLDEYRRVWPRVTQQAFLMPLVNKKGIYCFYTRALVQALAALIAGRRCVELGAGDGTLSRFLNAAGCAVKATDNHSWSAVIDYPDEVENLDAASALRAYRPQVALASWPDPDNTWEEAVFQSRGLECYIVLGSSVPGVTGNPKTYAAQNGWVRQERPDWAALVVPEELHSAVWVFTKR